MVGWGELGETARTYTQYYRGQKPMIVRMFSGSGANMKCFQAVSLTPDGYGITLKLPNLSYDPTPCSAGAVSLGANRGWRGTGPFT